jgi:hypothetical protein
MSAGGRMALLIPYNRVDVMEKIIKDNSFYIEEKVLVKQTEKHSPFRCMYMLTDVFSGFEERKITIRDEEFSELLKSYYL